MTAEEDETDEQQSTQRSDDNASSDNLANSVQSRHASQSEGDLEDVTSDMETNQIGKLSSLIVDVSLLPPLPIPRMQLRRRESQLGIFFVIFLCFLFVGLTHGVALVAVGGIETNSAAWLLFLILIYTEAAISLICLVGLIFTDPGVIQRSPNSCFPMPIQVEPWVRAHLDGNSAAVEPPQQAYIAASDPKRGSYCTKCLVWRTAQEHSKFYHCHTCKRCVEHFDHHCSFFGRCIAGNMWKGNIRYFYTIIVTCVMAYITTVIAVVWSLSSRYRPEIVIPLSFLCLWASSSCGAFAGCVAAVRRTLNLEGRGIARAH